MKTYIETTHSRPMFMKNLPAKVAPTATCSKCGKDRELPEGKRPLTSLCAGCMMAIEFELQDLFTGFKKGR